MMNQILEKMPTFDSLSESGSSDNEINKHTWSKCSGGKAETPIILKKSYKKYKIIERDF